MTVTAITFGEHPQSEFSLLPERVVIDPPEVQSYTVEVPGRDGALDFTEALDGLVHYKNRTVTMEMQCFAEDEDYAALESKCRGLLHGRRMPIRFDSDPGYYFLGRLSVDWASGPNIDTATITAECDPYRYQDETTVVEADVTGQAVLTLSNEQKPVCPLITASAALQLAFTIGGTEHTVSLSAGSQQVPALFLTAGSLPVTVTGTGQIKFEYQEGAL